MPPPVYATAYPSTNARQISIAKCISSFSTITIDYRLQIEPVVNKDINQCNESLLEPDETTNDHFIPVGRSILNKTNKTPALIAKRCINIFFLNLI
jgi:hypothetical protein